jgi:hypothetical protein
MRATALASPARLLALVALARELRQASGRLFGRCPWILRRDLGRIDAG